MHKKSIEAAQKLKEEEEKESESGKPDKEDSVGLPVNKEELRSESIASLRAKAQTYTAKIQEELRGGSEGGSDRGDNCSTPVTSLPPPLHSSFDSPHDENTCDSETLDPANWFDRLFIDWSIDLVFWLLSVCIRNWFEDTMSIKGICVCCLSVLISDLPHWCHPSFFI